LHEPRNWQREARAERQRSRLEAACQRAAESERERILRDLHDGCGGQLVTALRLTQGGAAPERIAAALQDCVDDLRITLEALTPTADDLLPLLAGFRNRSELRLDQHDIKLHWSCPDLPDLAGLAMGDCGQPLHVLRILQEALTNVIKHSGAQTVEVSLQIAATVPRALLILLRDDGHGMQPGRPGRGLANMARRAELIGAELELASTAGGTCLTLRVPLAPA
jgi:signal transduction histidine kinase